MILFRVATALATVLAAGSAAAGDWTVLDSDRRRVETIGPGIIYDQLIRGPVGPTDRDR